MGSFGKFSIVFYWNSLVFPIILLADLEKGVFMTTLSKYSILLAMTFASLRDHSDEPLKSIFMQNSFD